MKIIIVPLTEIDAVGVYESYRHDHEPDSPPIAFHDLSVFDQEHWIKRITATHRLIRRDGASVGFISLTILPDQTLNLGFGLFAVFRGQGLMGQILRQLLPEIQQTYPQHSIVAATRLANPAALKTLAQAGMHPTSVILMPPIGAYPDPIPYQQFSYTAPGSERQE